MVTIDYPQLFIGGAVFGVFNGFGNAIGIYISNKHIIERIERLKNGHAGVQEDNRKP